MEEGEDWEGLVGGGAVQRGGVGDGGAGGRSGAVVITGERMVVP